MNRVEGPRTALLTGGTAGFGAALADSLRQRGIRTVICGRSARSAPDSFECDLSLDDSETTVLRELSARKITRLDFLIHNAALGSVASVLEHSTKQISSMIHLNVKVPIRLTHALWSQLTDARGRVVLISSPLALIASPDCALYAASKQAIESFARSLKAEQSTVGVTVLVPPPMNTKMHAMAGTHRLGLDSDRFPLPRSVSDRFAERLLNNSSQIGESAWSQMSLSVSSRFPRLGESLRSVRLPIPELPESNARTILITGAAKGIGLALARRFALDGFPVHAVDCEGELLERNMRIVSRSTGTPITTSVCDLSHVETLDRLIDEWDHRGPFWAAIHNAGINRFGRFHETPLPVLLRLIDVNFLAPVVLSAKMLQRKQLVRTGRMAFVSSLSHFVGYPGSAVYAASKSGLASWASSLAVVGRSADFHVTTVFPGPTNTDQARENSPDPNQASRRMAPDKLATIIRRGLVRRRRWVIPGFSNTFFALLGTWFPTLTESAMRRALLPANKTHKPSKMD